VVDLRDAFLQKCQIAVTEVCARWSSLLSFIDSASALNAPVSGGSAALDMAPLSCGPRYVRLIASCSWIEWDASGSNAADAGSRVGITDTVALDLRIQLVGSSFRHLFVLTSLRCVRLNSCL